MHRDPTTIDLGARAVDVGYCNVKYTLGRAHEGNSQPVRTGLFPALAPRLAAARVASDPGSQKIDGCSVDVAGVEYFVGRDAQYNGSNLEPRTIAPEYCTTGKYLALLRGALNEMGEAAGGGCAFHIDDLVVGLPLTTFQQYRRQLAMRLEGEHEVRTSAGFTRHFRVGRAHVIVQPFGALLNFGVARKGELDGWTLVVDVGGGTLDWYVASRRKTNWARSGAYPKAMLACAYAIADRVNESWKDQINVVNRIDAAIRQDAQSFRVGGCTYELGAFRGVMDTVLEECAEKMFAKVGQGDDIDQVLLTGGGASVFHRYLAASRPELLRVMTLDADPVFSNVRGFHIYGEMQQGASARAR